MQIDILVSYDVNTEEKAGRRRLACVAKICKNFGQRVQDSVFECSLEDTDLERLRSKLLGVIKPEEDSLRIYYLRGLRDDYIEAYGLDKYVNFKEDTLIA